MVWKMTFPYFVLAIFFHFILEIFHSILKFSSMFLSKLPYRRTFTLEAMQRIRYFAPLQCCKQPLVKVRVTIQRYSDR